MSVDGGTRRPVDRQARWSAALAPLAMIGGWTVAAAVQAGPFDPVRETISALAAAPAAHPAVMTTALLVTGACHVVTASGLHAVPAPGRVLLATGGVATAAVAVFPVTAAPEAHGIAAGVAFVALALWPLGAWRRGGRGVVRRAVAVPAGLTLSALLAWFVVELQQATPSAGSLTGLAERVVAGAQSAWPLAVVVALGLASRGGRRPSVRGDKGVAADRPRV